MTNITAQKKYTSKAKHIRDKILSREWDEDMGITRQEYYQLLAASDKNSMMANVPAYDKFTSRGTLKSTNRTLPLPAEGMTAEWLREHFHYNPITGDMTRIRANQHKGIGRVIRTEQTAGYYYVNIYGKNYLVHRLAWLYMTGSWPTKWVDHINGQRRDNRWGNLREASHQDNLRYTPAPRNNTSGYKDISVKTLKSGRIIWVASVTVAPYKKGVKKGKTIRKQFDTMEEALSFRDKTLIEYFGEFAYLDYPEGHPKHMPYPKETQRTRYGK